MRANLSLDYDIITVERPHKLYLMARFESDDDRHKADRRPLNLSLVIDRSGSMAGDKIDYTRQAAQFLVQHLDHQDMFSIVLYNDGVETLLAPERIHNKDIISQLLDGIRVSGTTNLSGGWLEGCHHVSQHMAMNGLNRVILMTDGLANRGVTDQDKLIAMAQQKRAAHITTTTMGMGQSFNEDLMIDMANAGGGAFYFIESPEVAPTIFQEELSGLLNIIGQNLTVTIKNTPIVASIRQLNAYPKRTENHATIFQLGDIFANEIKTLVLEITIPALTTIGRSQIATLTFEYDDVADDNITHHVQTFPIEVNIQRDAEDVANNIDVTQQVLLLQAANARRDAVQAADKGNYQDASKILRETAQTIDSSHYIDDQLRDERNTLIEQAKQMDEGAKGYNAYSRKEMATQSLYTMTNRHDETVMLRRRKQSRHEHNTNKKITTTVTSASTSNIDSQIQREKGVPPTHVRYGNLTYALEGGLVRIGRDEHNEIVLDEKGVSRFHAQVRRIRNTLLFEDLGSTNGSSIDGVSIQEPYELSTGDIVFLSDEKLIFLNDQFLKEDQV